MEIHYLKDHLFDLLNESDLLDLQDIRSNEQADGYLITVHDGSTFNIRCHPINQDQTNKE